MSAEESGGSPLATALVVGLGVMPGTARAEDLTAPAHEKSISGPDENGQYTISLNVKGQS